MRRTQDPQIYRDTTEIQSSWPTYRNARVVAKSHLNQWNRDFSEEYEVTPEGADEYDSDNDEVDDDNDVRTDFTSFDENEGFRIETSMSEGEVLSKFTVWIEKKEVQEKGKQKAPSTTAKAAISKAASPPSAESEATSLVSINLSHRERNQSDIPAGRTNPNLKQCIESCNGSRTTIMEAPKILQKVHGIPDTYDKAVKAAKKVLLDQWDRDWFEQYKEEEKADESGGFEVWARCPEGEVFRIYIEGQPVPAVPYTLYTGHQISLHGLLPNYRIRRSTESLADANKAVRALLVYELCKNENPDAREPRAQHVEKLAKTIKHLKKKMSDRRTSRIHVQRILSGYMSNE
ncbi:hypothetical protein QFC21_005343 [Naganishia friedmannii]|uniref:Uncharacterized protein n=1 Tax=Naganishia friedmannii TaxID=89922 RepID=A0ACC2VBH7_9TREE|nr:hypothetical protein QFC21_005343 [Naganishia friedmannii]